MVNAGAQVSRHGTCSSGKLRYLTEAAATLAMLAQQGAPRWHGAFPIRAYRCPECNGWHLTKAPNPPVGAS